HLRIEIDNLDAFDVAYNMILEKKVHQISFMDHTPGQGQYRNLEIYKKIITSYKGKDIQELGFDGVLERHKNKEFLSFEKLRELTLLALENGISVSSHDDDTIEKLNINKEIGVSVSEFPISIATAKEAKKLGFHTVAGAPNILLGGSHSGNMSAAEAICEDCIDILCSDYYPSAMLHSIFIMNQKYNIPIYDMVNKVSLNPAKAMKIDSQYGSLEKGKKADILIIDVLDGYPVITTVLIDGYVTSSLEYRV
ncbi:MAG TPA: alpha-D-ribose 1-methylphosphonate 5-triphosphate diphosphatase, partial [Ruminiclostridium sp.]